MAEQCQVCQQHSPWGEVIEADSSRSILDNLVGITNVVAVVVQSIRLFSRHFGKCMYKCSEWEQLRMSKAQKRIRGWELHKAKVIQTKSVALLLCNHSMLSGVRYFPYKSCFFLSFFLFSTCSSPIWSDIGLRLWLWLWLQILTSTSLWLRLFLALIFVLVFTQRTNNHSLSPPLPLSKKINYFQLQTPEHSSLYSSSSSTLNWS